MLMTDDTEEHAQKYVDKHRVTFPVALDPGEISDDYELIGHPVSYFISTDGTILDRIIGPVDPEKLGEEFDRLFFDR